jgi:hypothetical protein
LQCARAGLRGTEPALRGGAHATGTEVGSFGGGSARGLPGGGPGGQGGLDPDALDVGGAGSLPTNRGRPALHKKAPPYDEYVVLEEAQAARSVKVSETGAAGRSAGGQEPGLRQAALYLLGGEVVLGGKQDRMVVNDTVVDPASPRCWRCAA